MEVQTNEHGQTLIYLSKEEWEDYGRQAGYMPEIIKEASTENDNSNENINEEEVNIASLQKKIESLSAEIAEIKQANSKSEEPAEIENNNSPKGFNEQNYPNLIAEQQQDGLIGVFAPRP